MHGEMAMFPIGAVLLPGMALPLTVFEDRYRQMLEVVLAAPDPEFGVVLIERGSEVGGGDVRVMTGCVARVLDATRSTDGRYVLRTVGTRRIRVHEWLPDDPYPRAVVSDWPDQDGRDQNVPDEEELDVVCHRLRRVAGLAAALGAPGLGPDLGLSADPTLFTFQVGVLAPLGPLDRLRVLEAAGPRERLDVTMALLGEQEELLAARLAFERGDPSDGTDGSRS